MDEEDTLMDQEENTRQHQLHQASQSSETATITRTNTLRKQWRRASTPPSTDSYIGPMTVVCHHCQGLRFPSEALNCCHSGQHLLFQRFSRHNCQNSTPFGGKTLLLGGDYVDIIYIIYLFITHNVLCGY